MDNKNIKKVKKIIESKSTFVFDFDGVLADSVGIKTWAFVELYKSYGPEVCEKVKNHHLKNGGMSRFDKFELYHKTFLNTHLSKNGMKELCKKFSNLVINAVINSPEILGVNNFLENYCINNKLSFVNSATPTGEIKKIIKKRDMDKYFTSVYGSPASKIDNLKDIFFRYNVDSNQTIFFGDAIADFKAAEITGCTFIGIGSEIEEYFNTLNSEPSIKYTLLSNFKNIV